MKKLNDKAFSMVELIIVIAVMAVLVGVLAPQYMKYLAKAEKAKDCSVINTILDTCEVMALDPDTEWKNGPEKAITITLGSNGVSYSGDASSELATYVPINNLALEATDWGPFTITAVKTEEGRVDFTIDEDEKVELGKYSETLLERLE